jgi:ribonuclease VapC
MVIDSSALIAVVRREPETERFLRIMHQAFPLRVSASTVVEASVVMLSRFGEAGLADLESLLTETSVEIVPLTSVQAKLAIDAFRRYGKGRHPAGLNFGDCFSYALAKATGEPLLFKGDDFSQTDIKRAA